jgi:hypothetical protein
MVPLGHKPSRHKEYIVLYDQLKQKISCQVTRVVGIPKQVPLPAQEYARNDGANREGRIWNPEATSSPRQPVSSHIQGSTGVCSVLLSDYFLIVKLKDGEMKAIHRPLLHLKRIRSYPILGGKSGVNASGIANFLFLWRGQFVMKLSRAIILKPNYLKTVSQGLWGSSTCDHKCSPGGL